MGGSRRGVIVGDGGVEAGDGGGEVLVQDVGDVGARVEGLVLRRVKVGRVNNLQSCVAAGRHGVGRVGDANAGVSFGQLLDVGRGDQNIEIRVRLGV